MPRFADDEKNQEKSTEWSALSLLVYERVTAVLQLRIRALCKMGAVFLGSINNETPPLPRMNG